MEKNVLVALVAIAAIVILVIIAQNIIAQKESYYGNAVASITCLMSDERVDPPIEPLEVKVLCDLKRETKDACCDKEAAKRGLIAYGTISKE